MTLGNTALVIGGSRGLGNALVVALLSRGLTVYTTVRSTIATPHIPSEAHVITGVDLASKGGGASVLAAGLPAGTQLDLVILSAGDFQTDTLDMLSWEDQLQMYTVCAIAPPFIARALLPFLAPGSKFLLITTEGGSIALRTAEEGGGNYGHHGSKAAANMVGRLLSFDLGKQGVTVVDIHPGFMKTEMTKSIGYGAFYESGSAVPPSEAATALLAFASSLTPAHNGSFWAPRGPRDVGQAERVMGKGLGTPLELPW